eukprot:Hpha_TRINITY_DN16170_c0_g11::TRINITY_DN16170_c0_g11_i1::g.8759::m.8759/K09527/DNAJC7; DnaJ homolog subfamily C member 7
MGFSVEDVLSDDSHTSEFICKVCNELVEWAAVSYTVCSHVFCSSCLDTWFAQGRRKCPCCQSGLKSTEVGSLRAANPLANRILGRVRVRCPLQSTTEGCSWRGEYSEVQSHLANSDSHTRSASAPTTAPSPVGGQPQRDSESAVALKEQGNAKFQARAYGDAITLYTKALVLDPQPTILVNRAAAYLMEARWRECAADCEAALDKEAKLPKAYSRLAKARVHQGELAGAVDALRKGTQLMPENADLRADLAWAVDIQQWVDEGEAALVSDRPSDAARFFGSAAKATTSHPVLLMLARAELALGRSDSVLRVTRDILRDDRGSVAALAVRAEALLLATDFQQATAHAQEAVRLDPDDTNAARTLKRVRKVGEAVTRGRQQLFRREFAPAEVSLSEAIELARAPPQAALAAELHADRAQVKLRLGRHQEALKDCGVAVGARDDCRQAWLTRAAVLTHLGRYAEVMEEIGRLMKNGFENDEAVRGAYQKAEFEQRRVSRPDYYAVLGVSSVATEAEVRAAYRQRALVFHPDRLEPDASAEVKAKAEAEFKVLGDALEVLTNDFARRLWDEGHDKKAIEERIRAAEEAARRNPRGKHHHGH